MSTSFWRWVDGHQYVWDVDALAWVAMSQPILNAGSVTVSGTLNQGTGGSSAWKVDGSAVTQPVSGTFYQVTQPVSIASMPSTPVTGPLTDTQLRLTAVPISGSVSAAISGSISNTAFLATQPTGSNLHVVVDTAPSTAVTNANLDVALSTLATASAQTSGNSSLTTIASNSPLAATSAKQDTGNTSLASILAALPAIQTINGEATAFLTDPDQRRVQELTYLQAQLASWNALLDAESANSGRSGFELR